jgi:peptide/nickel transport system substrate-binding protein
MSNFIKGLLMFLCGGAVLFGCGTGADRDATSLRIAFEAAPSGLDPRYATDAYASRVGSLVFSSLVLPSDTGGYEPYVARAWESPDERTWVFHLRTDFVFHDGTPLRAADVIATYRALLAPEMGSPRRAMLAQVSSVDAVGVDTVVFRLARADAAFLDAATLAVLPERLATTRNIAPGELTGAGPYRIVTATEDGSIHLAAFEHFALGPPTLPDIEIRVVGDGMMRALELRHGSIGFVQNALDPDTVEWMSTHVGNVTIRRCASSNFQYLGINLDVPMLADVRVRRALAYAIDRKSIVRHVLAGQARVADGLLPPQNWAYAFHKRRYRFDPERARRLLDRAGFNDPDGSGPLPRMTLSYKTTTQDLARRTAEAIAEQLGAVGIHLDISTYEWATFFEDIKRGSFHLYSLQWVGITDPDMYRQVLHSAMVPPAGNNRGRYRNVHMDHLTERAATTMSRDLRRRLYARVQRREARELPYIPLWWPERVVVATNRLKDFRPAPSGDLFALYRSRLAPPSTEPP